MRQTFLSCLSLIALCFILPATVEACSCLSSGAPCESFWKTDAVFSGQVTEIKDTPVKPVSNSGDETASEIRALPFRTKTVRFAVNESFRGIEERSIELETGFGGGDCGFAFQTGESYLVYAYLNKETGKLGANICSRTRLLSKSSEDLEYFRGLKDQRAGGTVYGKVTKYLVRKSDDDYKPNPPLANIKLTFQGNENSYEALTDEKGEYRLSNLQAGEYKMLVKVPEGMWGFEKKQTIKIPDKGCAATYTALSVKTFIGGKIQTEEAAPAAKISVNLIPVDQINERHHKDKQYASTDEQGRFLFKSIPAGTYYLGVRLDGMSDTDFPYPRTFYPGTTDLQNAVPITVNEGQIIENFDFTLAKKLTTRKIRGVVLMPDGKPVAKAYVCVEEVEYSEGSMCRGSIDTDAKGQFTFTLPNNLRYLIRAHVSLTTGQRHAEPIEVAANGDVSDIKIVITEANGSCEKCRVWKRGNK